MSIQVAILCDNRAHSARFECEHGLSVYVCVDGYKMLLDTGQTDKCLRNAQQLGIDLSQLDAIVLSHGHYDHTGGLPAVLRLAQHAKIVAHPDVVRPRFSVSSVMQKPNGFPQPEVLQNADVVWVSNLFQLTQNITIFTIPKPATPNPALQICAGGQMQPDPFSDELFVLVRSNDKTLLYGGCTHHGIAELLGFAEQQFDLKSLSCFVGGLHLRGRSPEVIASTANLAARFGVEQWVINHCSGEEAILHWRNRFGSKPEKGFAGAVWEV